MFVLALDHGVVGVFPIGDEVHWVITFSIAELTVLYAPIVFNVILTIAVTIDLNNTSF